MGTAGFDAPFLTRKRRSRRGSTRGSFAFRSTLGERSRDERHPIAVTVYPDAYHTFDFRGPRVINQWGKTLEHKAAATADAERRVDTFLRALKR